MYSCPPKVPFLPLLVSILTWLLENNSPRPKASSYWNWGGLCGGGVWGATQISARSGQGVEFTLFNPRPTNNVPLISTAYPFLRSLLRPWHISHCKFSSYFAIINDAYTLSPYSHHYPTMRGKYVLNSNNKNYSILLSDPKEYEVAQSNGSCFNLSQWEPNFRL